ncbi:hypothetical protein [Helicobacter pylori]|uniref:hypothetical protein n=1 Tax=Helicobacter pylori TaxID=210 RepID=UPI000EB13461|nr:hypothetical protein [Helicobacter pylori]
MKIKYRNFFLTSLILFTLLNFIDSFIGVYNTYKVEKIEKINTENLEEIKEIIKEANEHLKLMNKKFR